MSEEHTEEQQPPRVETNPSEIGVSISEIGASHMEVEETTDNPMDTSTAINPVATTENEEVSEEQSLLISQFCEMTGKDTAYAKNVLEVRSYGLFELLSY